MNILIAGGSGLVGSHLTSYLVAEGHIVRHLSRKKYTHMLAEVFEWDPKKNWIDPNALEELDVVINLAGAGVADKKWTKARKEVILKSRIDSTKCLNDNLLKVEQKPGLMIQASAIGFYGNLPFNSVSTESDPQGNSFLAEVCRAWEAEAFNIKSEISRQVVIRIGVVLSDRGGALPKIMQPIQLFAGAALGSGDQWVNWIHIDDLCGMIYETIKNEKIEGIFNGVASHPVTNSALTDAIAKRIKRPIWLPNVPSFIMKTLMGEMAEIVLEGNVVSNKKILEMGFQYKYESLSAALDELLSED